MKQEHEDQLLMNKEINRVHEVIVNNQLTRICARSVKKVSLKHACCLYNEVVQKIISLLV